MLRCSRDDEGVAHSQLHRGVSRLYQQDRNSDSLAAQDLSNKRGEKRKAVAQGEQTREEKSRQPKGAKGQRQKSRNPENTKQTPKTYA